MVSSTPAPRLVLYLLGLALSALANTEIINFKSVLAPSLHANDRTNSWPILDSHVHERLLTLNLCSSTADGSHAKDRCSDDAWVVLDLDDPAWSGYDAFTVKISNPASVPVDYDIELFTPLTLPARLANASNVPSNSLTRRQYAHISTKLSSVPVPVYDTDIPRKVPVNLALEPLFLGVVPVSVIPLIASIPVLLLLAHLVTTYLVMPKLDSLARNARAEMDALAKKR